jgi:hypothetical protein
VTLGGPSAVATSTASSQPGWEAWEALDRYPVEEDRRQALYERQVECAVVWTTAEGWPIGVMHWFVWHDGAFWVTAGVARKRIAALRRRPESSVIVTSAGTDVGRSVTVTARTVATIHDDAETADWFFPALARKAHGKTPTAGVFERMLRSTARVVIELRPVAYVTYDAARMHAAIQGAARGPAQPGGGRETERRAAAPTQTEEVPVDTKAEQSLADRQAVVDLGVRYTMALDSRDWPLLRSCFVDEATVVYEGLAECDGVDAVVRVCRAALEPLDASQHMVTNFVVTLDADRATMTSYVHAQHVRADAPGGTTYVVAGRYEDELVRTEGGWRIARRRFSPVWTQGNIAVLQRATRVTADS